MIENKENSEEQWTKVEEEVDVKIEESEIIEENKEEDIVWDLYEVYGKLRKISHSNISTGSTFMSYDGSSSFGSGSTHVTIDPSNHPDLCTNNATGGYGSMYDTITADDTIQFG